MPPPPGFSSLLRYFFKHPEKDIAILKIDEPMDIEHFDLEFSRKGHDVGDSAGYCGYPNRKDLACFTGRVSGFASGYINIHTYAFSGASGSLVVDMKGRAVGILSGIEVGTFYGVPTPLESVVWVVPLDPDVLSSL